MKDITTRADLHHLVSQFYAKVRKDDVLGDIFNRAIQEWPEHIEHLTDFWESNILYVPKFLGNPPLKHKEVDRDSNHTISQFHFNRWLNIWWSTIDELFEGDKATEAKERARSIATVLFSIILKGRSET